MVGGKGEKKKQTVFSGAKELGDGRRGNQGIQPNSVPWQKPSLLVVFSDFGPLSVIGILNAIPGVEVTN